MNIVSRANAATSIDFITEAALTDQERIVDTRAFFDVGFPYHRNGPIYVSESTVKAMARALGCVLVNAEDAETVNKIISGLNAAGAPTRNAEGHGRDSSKTESDSSVVTVKPA